MIRYVDKVSNRSKCEDCGEPSRRLVRIKVGGWNRYVCRACLDSHLSEGGG